MAQQKVLSSYINYEESIVKKYLILDNIISNRFGSVVSSSFDMDYMLLSGLLFSDNVENSNMIINKIKDIEIEPDFMNSRCHPTGLFIKGNDMIVGEAPGQKGRSIKPEYLKPSFIFEKPSFILRNSIKESFNRMPYITNLLKYARSDNKVTKKDFDKTSHIFDLEVDLLSPKRIFVLGRNAFEYLSEKYSNVIYIKHPAAILYTGEDINEYKASFKEKIKC